ncbi:hypothetical protein O181_089920 [Austropuccinia psidii MF-1]|uniref:Uncharacterized protein n=1 Tax=Austropuccinia psidii MF-1 TaxID=1389203 RepID=A0A9Q3P6K2_9BASI|nr:hypothetical protein [Austropuccinia psidii MF-1]
MFFYSVDEHTLNVTEADGTGIYGPSDLHRLRFHNGQRYSVIVQTKKKDAGKSFYMRARMDPDCWSWVFNDVQLTALGIIALTGDDSYVIGASSSETAPQTVDWPDEFTSECLDINTNSMVPIIQRSVPRQVSGSGAFQNAFGFEIIATGGIITRAEAAASAANNSSLRQDALKNGTFNSTDRAGPLPAASRGTGELLDKREIKLGQPNLPLKHTSYWESITRIAGPPPTPAGTIGKFFVNNKSWKTSPYQPVLHDLLPSGSRARISPTIANVVYPTVGWYDLYLVNLDPVASHPYHLHALDMHLVAIGQGLPTQETIANLTYKTENPLRRDTIVIGGGSFAVVRINADIPGAWLMHCHIGWHLEGGFAGIVMVQPEVVKTFKIPQANLNLCPSRKPPLDAIGPRGTNIIRKTLKVMKTWDIL